MDFGKTKIEVYLDLIYWNFPIWKWQFSIFTQNFGKRAMLGPSKTPYPVTKQPSFHLANAQSNHVIPVFLPKIAAQMPNWVGKKKRKDQSLNGNLNFPHYLVE